MQHQSEICIVGFGAIAKTAALGFAQAGHSVTLIGPPADKSAAVAEGWDVRVYALNQVAHDLLSSLKVWDAMDAARIAPVEGMQVNGDGAEHAGHLAFDAYGARVGALAWIVEDANLNKALDTALKFARNITMLSVKTTSLTQDATSATVQLENGDSVIANLVVGADGAQSWVRGQCDIDIDYRSYGQRAIVTNFACELPHQGVAHQWFSAEEGIIALLPLPGNQVSLVWSAPQALSEVLLAETLSALAQRLHVYCGKKLGQLTPLQPENVKAFPLNLIRPRAITALRVALVGDAAHVVHPLAGHGMNLGFGDVVALLEILAQREQLRECGDARILSRYARARKEDILLMQVATDGLERLFSSDFEPLRMARNLGMNLVDKLPFIKRRLISHALGNRR
jgi:ubiquinone biosynthesis UbiH/UbiF/VisC/COQ6 family hydroxylase